MVHVKRSCIPQVGMCFDFYKEGSQKMDKRRSGFLLFVLLEDRPPGVIDEHVGGILGLADAVEACDAVAILTAEV